MTFSTSSKLPIKMPDRSWMCSGTTSSILFMSLLIAWPPAVTPSACVQAKWITCQSTWHSTVLKDQSHRSTLVEDSQLAPWALLVRRVGEDATVQQRPVGISHHAANVSRTVWFPAFRHGILQAVKVLLDRFLPVQAVTLVDAVRWPSTSGCACWDA